MKAINVQLRKPLDLNEWAYITVKDMILKNEYSTGEQIHIEELTKSLQISRTPVREALLRLQTDGLVEVIPHVGCFVKGITMSEFRELCELRRIIECHTAAYAAMTMSDEDILSLKEAYEPGAREIEAGNYDVFTPYEIVFHNFLIEYSKNKLIIKVMANLSDQILRDRMLALKSRENIILSNQEHRKVIHAIEMHNPQKASAAMEEHLLKVEERLLKIIPFAEEKSGN